MIRVPVPCLCAVTARRRLSPQARTLRDEVHALRRFLDELVAARVDFIQIREPDLAPNVLTEIVQGAVKAATDSLVRIIVNTNLDVAMSADAHGLHLRQDEPLSAETARGRGFTGLIGRSRHPGYDGVQEPLDYWMFGTVYPTLSKPGEAAGLAALRDVVRASAIPVLAIGGITPERTRECLEAGAAGVAAIGSFLPPGLADDARGPGAAVAAFRGAFTF
jgi:thiamine-phosphate pyrophosphorylase